jgi:hypothetical protein
MPDRAYGDAVRVGVTVGHKRVERRMRETEPAA